MPCKNKEDEGKYREENKEQKKAYDKKYRLENKERIKEDKKKYHEENKERIKEHGEKYREENIEKVREGWRKTNKRRREETEIKRIEKGKGTCEVCEKEFWPEKNHPNQICCSVKCNNKKWRRENKEHWRKYCEENKENIREIRLKSNYKNREKINEKAKKYGKEHPEQRRATFHRRRARIKSNGGSFTAEEIIILKKESKGFCMGYKRELHFVGIEKLEIDHVIPIMKGGTSFIENIQLLCKNCNLRKGIN